MRPRRAQALHERREVRVAAELAVARREPLEIEVGERIRGAACPRDAVALQEGLAHEMRGLAPADVDARLAEVHRQKLPVYVRDVKKRKVAERGDMVERVCRL